VTDELSDREQALRKLPLPYSLSLRLRDAGVAAEVICEYLGIEQAHLEGIYRLAAAKLCDAQELTNGQDRGLAESRPGGCAGPRS
jgi:hypothetical protein